MLQIKHQRSDTNGQDLHGLHKMTALWGGRCCCSFSLNKRTWCVLLSFILLTIYVHLHITVISFKKMTILKHLKNDLKCHHSSTFTYRHEGMSGNTANINGSLFCCQWRKVWQARKERLDKQSCFFAACS